jgi:hypothetical protein
MTRTTKDRDADEEEGNHEDGLVENYRTILNELSLLTTVSVLLFGFLLASTQSFADTTLEEVLYSIAIVLVATATLIFIMPVAYHHIQFPYEDFDKFTERTHGWMLLGLPLLGASFYLSLSLSIWSLLGGWALVIGAVPLAATLVVFLMRKEISGELGQQGRDPH